MKKYSITQYALMLHMLTHKLTGPKLDQAIEKFTHFIIKNKAGSHLERIIAVYQELIDKQENCVRAKVSTAYQLSEIDKESVRTFLTSVTDKNVVIEETLDPALVSGLKIAIGDTVYDMTAQRSLLNLQKQLSI